jgi:type IV pilus assembly protein PilP
MMNKLFCLVYLGQHTIIFLCIISLIACSSSNKDLIKYIHQIKHKKLKDIQPFPVFASVPQFNFSVEPNRRNPFKAMNLKKQSDFFVPQKSGVTRLKAYSLDVLKFVGTLSQGEKIWALIRQPDLKIIHVHLGEYVGKNHARIRAINTQFIKLEELIRNSSGRLEKHITILNLYTGN